MQLLAKLLAVLRPHQTTMETKSGTPKELKISLSHGLENINPLPTLFGTLSIPRHCV